MWEESQTQLKLKYPFDEIFLNLWFITPVGEAGLEN